MNREIKFRALYEGVWYYQTLEEMLTITLAAFRLGMHKTQFTDLYDKNGNGIFEGDIVNVDNSEPEENGENDAVTVCKWETGCFVLEDLAGGHWTRMLFHKPRRLTVIGNIYENSDLINQ